MLNVKKYVLAHWLGSLPLPISYWVNLVLAQRVTGWLLEYLSKHAPLLLVLVATLLIFLSGIWSVVGAWRSASAYSICNSKLWGHISKVTIVLGLLGGVISIFA